MVMMMMMMRRKVDKSVRIIIIIIIQINLFINSLSESYGKEPKATYVHTYLHITNASPFPVYAWMYMYNACNVVM